MKIASEMEDESKCCYKHQLTTVCMSVKGLNWKGQEEKNTLLTDKKHGADSGKHSNLNYVSFFRDPYRNKDSHGTSMNFVFMTVVPD